MSLKLVWTAVRHEGESRMDLKKNQPLPIGHRIGAFEVVSVIADGGFGITYKAIDRNLERTVAI